jgi:hypothetical protein
MLETIRNIEEVFKLQLMVWVLSSILQITYDRRNRQAFEITIHQLLFTQLKFL